MADDVVHNREAVAAEVRAMMGRRRVSQGALARAMGMSQSALSRRLMCEHPFDMDDLFALSKHFEVPVTAFMGDPTTLRRATPSYLDSIAA